MSHEDYLGPTSCRADDATSALPVESMQRTNRDVLTALMPEQLEAVASFIESARPWQELGLDPGPSLTLDDVTCLLSIIADSMRLHCGRESAAVLPCWADGR